jgi:hypothetical protein
MTYYDSSTLPVTIGGLEAKPMTDLTQNAPEVYLGRFSGGRNHLRFTPASESPEITIEHLFERWQKWRMMQPAPESGLDGNEPDSGQTSIGDNHRLFLSTISGCPQYLPVPGSARQAPLLPDCRELKGSEVLYLDPRQTRRSSLSTVGRLADSGSKS